MFSLQALTANKPAPAGVGAEGLAVASDGSVALLSGSGPMGSQSAHAYLFSFYNSVGQYNSCPQKIEVRAQFRTLATSCRTACATHSQWHRHAHDLHSEGPWAHTLKCELPFLERGLTRLVPQDPAPLSGLTWGSAFAVSGDASTVLVGAAGTVISGALSGQGSDRSIDGKVRMCSTV